MIASTIIIGINLFIWFVCVKKKFAPKERMSNKDKMLWEIMRERF